MAELVPGAGPGGVPTVHSALRCIEKKLLLVSPLFPFTIAVDPFVPEVRSVARSVARSGVRVLPGPLGRSCPAAGCAWPPKPTTTRGGIRVIRGRVFARASSGIHRTVYELGLELKLESPRVWHFSGESSTQA